MNLGYFLFSYKMNANFIYKSPTIKMEVAPNEFLDNFQGKITLKDANPGCLVDVDIKTALKPSLHQAMISKAVTHPDFAERFRNILIQQCSTLYLFFFCSLNNSQGVLTPPKLFQ
eukprot:TRINITY_DN17336_c0_g1_i1.p1 TRINITY_DN17336_c0_g1~~TRINITY_DN17336_c0_g1_i1.p1  ORF type:complete len:115 (+),score=9.62 TRINITY_DN17336_c0_g1_i1:1-345(+)